MRMLLSLMQSLMKRILISLIAVSNTFLRSAELYSSWLGRILSLLIFASPSSKWVISSPNSFLSVSFEMPSGSVWWRRHAAILLSSSCKSARISAESRVC